MFLLNWLNWKYKQNTIINKVLRKRSQTIFYYQNWSETLTNANKTKFYSINRIIIIEWNSFHAEIDYNNFGNNNNTSRVTLLVSIQKLNRIIYFMIMTCFYITMFSVTFLWKKHTVYHFLGRINQWNIINIFRVCFRLTQYIFRVCLSRRHFL